MQNNVINRKLTVQIFGFLKLLTGVGRFDGKQLPKYQVIDWIEYYEYKADKTFALKWRDDFNKFDDKRWGKGDWGFESNLVTFSPDNVHIVVSWF